MRTRLTFGGFLLAIGACASPCAAAPCPSNTLRANQQTVTTSDSIASIGHSRTCDSHLPGGGDGFAHFDLVSGHWRVEASAWGECSGNASLATHDVFTLIGPAGSAGIEFTIRLDVTVYDFSGATLREGTSNEQSTTFGRGTQVLEVRVGSAVGETFDLRVLMSAAADHNGSGSASAHLTFPDLPTGFAVSSCQGYVSDIAVAAGRTSWGRVKALYR